MFRTWIPALVGNPAPTPRRPFLPRLRVEALEDRTAPSTFEVLNLGDSGAGSLRQALLDANAAPGQDDIAFRVAGTIQLTSGALPAVTDPVDLDGSTAPGFAGTPVVEVDSNGFTGLRFVAGSAGSTLRSLAYINARVHGVRLVAGDILVVGNYLGVRPDGATAAGNGGDGIRITPASSGNTIGGAADGEGNLISGNAGNGIGIAGSADNMVIANFIGTDATGTADLGNAGHGILVTEGAMSNLIGGTTPLPAPPPDEYNGKPVDGNLISGNGGHGVLINRGSEFNQLSGNFIGTDLSGNAPIGNALDGVAIISADNNGLLGTPQLPVPLAQPFVFYNVIGGNGGNGLRIRYSDNTVVQANFFGLGADNETPVGNALDGVLIEGSSANTQFGGVIPLGNVSAANGRHGVEIRDTARGTVVFNTFGGLAAFDATPDVGNALDGIHVTSTGGNNQIRTNVLSGNGDDGLEISGSATGVEVTETIIGLNTFGFTAKHNGGNGLEIGGYAHHNTIGGFERSIIPENTISGNLGHGLAILGNAHHNEVFNTFLGFDVLGDGMLGNGGAGIFIGDQAHHNTLGGTAEGQRNLIGNNGGHGIELAGAAHDNELIANDIGSNGGGDPGFGNTGAGVFLGDGTRQNTLTDNSAVSNGAGGFVLDGSRGNLLTGNTAEDNTGDGFSLAQARGNTLQSNTATGNTGDGFHVENSNRNQFLENTANANAGFGFFVDAVLDNVFTDNQCAMNGLGGSNQPGIC